MDEKYYTIATELAYWAQECAASGRNQHAPQDDVRRLYAETDTTWTVTFTDGDGEYEIGLGQVSFMGNASARDDQIVMVTPNNN